MIPALIGAAASIAGGIMSNNATNKANKSAQQAADQEYARQKEFAQSGVQWKVKDAEAAGIHPLYALGANTVSYAPQTVGSSSKDFSWLGDAGQNIGRAIDSTRGPNARMQALALTAAGIQLEGNKLDNDIKRAQLASLISTTGQAGHGPGIPTNIDVSKMGSPEMASIEGPTTKIQNTVSPSHKGSPNVEYAAGPEVRIVKTPKGYAPVIPQELSESFEQDWPGRYQWMWRNKLAADPNVLRVIPTRLGFRKHYSPMSGEYYYAKYPVYRKKFRELKGYPRW